MLVDDLLKFFIFNEAAFGDVVNSKGKKLFVDAKGQFFSISTKAGLKRQKTDMRLDLLIEIDYFLKLCLSVALNAGNHHSFAFISHFLHCHLHFAPAVQSFYQLAVQLQLHLQVGSA